MRMLTDLPAWAGVSILLLVDVLVLALARAHDQRQMTKMLRTERKRMEEWADQRADQLADERYTQRLIEEKIRRNRR